MSGICITLEMQDAVAARLYEHELNRCGLVFDTVDYPQLPETNRKYYRDQARQAIKGLWESGDWQELLAGIWDEGCNAGAVAASEADAKEFGLTGDPKEWAMNAIIGIRNPYRTPDTKEEQ